MEYDLDEKDLELFEKIFSNFKSMNEQEQQILFKLLIFSYLECSKKSIKGKNKKTWKIQATTYSSLISLFTKNDIINYRKFIFKMIEDEYNDYFGKSKLA